MDKKTVGKTSLKDIRAKLKAAKEAEAVEAASEKKEPPKLSVPEWRGTIQDVPVSEVEKKVKQGKQAKPAKPVSDKPKGPAQQPPNPNSKASLKKKARKQCGRLPDGSRFEADYDAGKKRWTGTLTILQEGGGDPLIFQGSTGGVFRLMMSLDSKYRDHVAKTTPPVEAVKSEETKLPEGKVV